MQHSMERIGNTLIRIMLTPLPALLALLLILVASLVVAQDHGQTDEPELRFPEDNTSHIRLDPIFEWYEPSQALDVNFNLLLAEAITENCADRAILNWVELENIAASPIARYHLLDLGLYTLKLNTSYCWFVKAVYADEVKESIETFRFTTTECSPCDFAPVSPENNTEQDLDLAIQSAVYDVWPVFKWQSSGFAVQYRFIIWEETAGQDAPHYSKTLNADVLCPKNPEKPCRLKSEDWDDFKRLKDRIFYRWKVIAEDIFGNRAVSAPYRFILDLKIPDFDIGGPKDTTVKNDYPPFVWDMDPTNRAERYRIRLWHEDTGWFTYLKTVKPDQKILVAKDGEEVEQAVCGSQYDKNGNYDGNYCYLPVSKLANADDLPHEGTYRWQVIARRKGLNNSPTKSLKINTFEADLDPAQPQIFKVGQHGKSPEKISVGWVITQAPSVEKYRLVLLNAQQVVVKNITFPRPKNCKASSDTDLKCTKSIKLTKPGTYDVQIVAINRYSGPDSVSDAFTFKRKKGSVTTSSLPESEEILRQP